MTKHEFNVLTAIYNMARSALWIAFDKRHCGGDFKEECKPCGAFKICKMSNDVDVMISNIKIEG